MEDVYQSLFNYFDKEIAEGKIDFKLRATKTTDGIEFYIHPDSKNGETIDLKLWKQQYTSVSLGLK